MGLAMDAIKLKIGDVVCLVHIPYHSSLPPRVSERKVISVGRVYFEVEGFSRPQKFYIDSGYSHSSRGLPNMRVYESREQYEIETKRTAAINYIRQSLETFKHLETEKLLEIMELLKCQNIILRSAKP